MHRWILGATVLAAGAQAAGSPVECPRPGGTVVERFTSADCADCWTRTPRESASNDDWLFDWIVPATRGDEAALSSAAATEARERVARGTGSTLADGQETTRRTPLRQRSGLQLRVTAGPAWNGYFAVQFDAKGSAPRGSSGWLALVEIVPEGTDGTPVARHLVRTVAGPINLDALRPARPVRALQAMRWPETAKPARLRARAWIEAADGRVIAVTAERCSLP